MKKYGLKEGDAENPSALVGQAKTWSLSKYPVNEQLAGIVREAQRDAADSSVGRSQSEADDCGEVTGSDSRGEKRGC